MFPIKNKIDLESIPPANRWGAIRKFDRHTGVDLACEEGTEVLAFEDGIVTDVYRFTGASIGFPFWAETDCCVVEGKSGIILYGEMFPPIVKIGDSVKEGQVLGTIKTVLLKDKGLPMSMLHIEWYEFGYRGRWAEWELKEENPPVGLKNIEKLIFKTQ